MVQWLAAIVQGSWLRFEGIKLEPRRIKKACAPVMLRT
jgi:hypothetical protein